VIFFYDHGNRNGGAVFAGGVLDGVMNSDVIGEGLGELEAIFLAAVDKVLVESEIVLVEFLDLAGFDIRYHHVDIFNTSFDKLLDGIVDERTITDWQHGFLDNFGDRESAGAPAGNWNDSFCNHFSCPAYVVIKSGVDIVMSVRYT